MCTLANLCVPQWLPLQHKYRPKRRPEIDERRAKKRLSEERLESSCGRMKRHISTQYLFSYLSSLSSLYTYRHCHMWPLWQASFTSILGLVVDYPPHGSIQCISSGASWLRNLQPELGSQSRIRSQVWDLLCCQGMTLPVHGTSVYTGIRTSHVFRPGIEAGSTAWKSRTLTTQPATHIDIVASLLIYIVTGNLQLLKHDLLGHYGWIYISCRPILY